MKKFLSFLAVTSMVILAAFPAFATSAAATSAGGEVSDTITNVSKNLKDVPQLINYASYIIGVGLGVAGIASLKKHAEQPAQEPIKNGLGRLAAASLFISLPFVLDMVRNTQAVDTGAKADYVDIDVLP